MTRPTVTILNQRPTVQIIDQRPTITVTAPGPQGPAGTVLYDGGGPDRGTGAIAIDCGSVT